MSSAPAKILIVEDEDIIRHALRKLLAKHHFQVEEAASIPEAQSLALDQYALIISDLRLPGGQGTDLIARAPRTPVLIMTSYASMRSAVDAMKLGAVDYIAKPFDHKEMIETVTRILEQKRPTSVPPSASTPTASRNFEKLVGHSASMKAVLINIEKVAPTNATVLVCGETGTGKELVARALHELSPRSAEPFISVNCAAIPEHLIESELFGHDPSKGANDTMSRGSLMAAANGGTLFLDEIGELPPDAQARLLRTLQETDTRTTDQSPGVRLIAATQRNLQQRCQEGKFREDLYFRINVFRIDMPPLREHKEDIPRLTDLFLAEFSRQMNRTPPVVAESTRQALQSHDWPGNVRELKNTLQRALILNGEQQPLLPEHLELQRSTRPTPPPVVPPATTPPPVPGAENLSLDEYFVRFVREHEAQHNETELARLLGVSRKTLWERRQKLGIPRKR